MRFSSYSIFAAALGIGVFLGSSGAHADLTAVQTFNIEPQTLSGALIQFSKQADVQVVGNTQTLENLASQGLAGHFSGREALRRLLSNQPVVFQEVTERSVRILPSKEANTHVSQLQLQSNAPSAAERHSGAADGKESDTRAGDPIEEILVTAQKRGQERLQDVPIPLTVVGANILAENNKTRLRDYFDTIPGFIVSPGAGAGNQQMLIVRGISSGAFGIPTVGVTVDDVPYGTFAREFSPDIDPSDLARVEVLRGPQGALYGSNSMGGLLKYVTVDPSTERVSGRAEGGINSVNNGAQMGYAFRGAVNVPIGETFAIRASAFTRQDPGYIDNSRLGMEGVNKAEANGGRLSGLWQLSDSFSLKLSALYQKTRADGLNDVVIESGLGDLEQNYIRSAGASEQTIQAYSAILTGHIGRVDLTSATGYNVFRWSSVNDYTSLYGASAQRLFNVAGAPLLNHGNTNKLSQEVRAEVPLTEALSLLVGGFYTHEKNPYFTDVFAADPASSTVVGTVLTLDIPIEHTEYAAFADLTVRFTDRFDVQFGGRQSRLETEFKAVNEGGALFASPIVIPAIEKNTNIFTYLVTPRFRVSKDMMIYGRVASGYRPSRANSFNPDPLVPRTAQPDRTTNYEIGLKGDLLDRKLSFDASLFYIDWTDIQIQLLSPRNNITYYDNGGAAKSEGAELAITAKPGRGFVASGWVTYNRAVLAEDFPAGTAAYGQGGNKTPYSAPWSANLSLDQEFPLTGRATGFAGATLSYMGERQGPFVATPARATYPSYTKVDLRVGVRLEDWLVNVYATNVGDKRGLIGGGPGNFPSTSFMYIQPRTVGLSVSRTF